MKSRTITRHLIAGSTALAAFLVYLPALKNDFVNWDDDSYVYENMSIQGITSHLFRWAFTSFHATNWHPLTWISHAVDYAIYGLNPWGHHLSNNILHTCNTFLVTILIVRLLEIYRLKTVTDGLTTFLDERTILIAGGVTGLIFGLHPIHVESVAWVAERKDVLCALFFLLSIIMYTDYVNTVDRRGDQRVFNYGFLHKQYLISLGFFGLALLSKPMAVTLPFVLLILDWYPFNRILSLRTFLSVVLEKLPFAGLSFGSSVLTILAQQTGADFASMEMVPLSSRVLVAVHSVMIYLWKMMVPVNLIPIYPYPKTVSIFSGDYLLPIIAFMGITMLCLRAVRASKLWLSVWAYYLATLFPVIGFVQVGIQSMADRYTYLPGIGPFMLMGLSVAHASKNLFPLKTIQQTIKLAGSGLVILAIVCMPYLTFKQIGIWENSLHLWNYIIEKSSDPFARAYYNRGVTFQKMGQLVNALEDYGIAIKLNPSYYKSYNNRGVILLKMDRLDEALRDFDQVILLKPDDDIAYYNRRIILLRKE